MKHDNQSHPKSDQNMRHNRFTLFLISFLLISIFVFLIPHSLLSASPDADQPLPQPAPVTLEAKKTLYSLGTHLEYLEDPTGALNIEDVSSPELEAQFSPSQQEVLDFGVTSSAYWVRFELQTTGKDQKTWVVDTGRNDWRTVQLYFPVESKSWAIEKTGKGHKFDQPDYDDYYVTLRLPTPLQPTQTIYLRFDSDHEMALDLRLWPIENPQLDMDWNLYLSGIFHGILVIMVIYNLFLFVSIREKSYLYYALYVSALTSYIMLIDGVGIHLLWRHSIWTLEHQDAFSIGVFHFSFALFVKAFLQTPKYAPRVDKVLSFLVVVNIGVTILLLFAPYDSKLPGFILPPLALAGVPVFITAAVIGIKKGYSPAKFFLIAGSTFYAGGILFGLQLLKVIPGTIETGFLYMKLGVLIEAVLYSFALADRLKYEKRLKAEAQKQALENLQKADQIKDEFLANTSHELRTPLNGIIGLAETTIHDLEHGSVQKMYSNLLLIIASGRRLSLLVNDILDFSKLKHKEIHLNRRPISLHRVVESVLILNQTSISQKPIQLVNHVDKLKTPLVLADEARLEQILYNLVSNAIKFTHEGAVTISAQQLEQHIVISVADTGIGIPKAKQAHIFNAFEQIDGTETRQYEGTGLGLTIVKQLVELHQSELIVESEEHHGSVFSFSLPVASDTEIDLDLDPLLQKIPEISQISLSRSTPHFEPESFKIELQSTEDSEAQALPSTFVSKGFLDILVVDDDPLNIEVICQHLNSRHYTLQVARNGSEALHLVEQKKPDLILLDVMMPEVSGFEVCKFLRKQHHQNHLPIIFLTAKNREADVLRGLEIGGNDYLTKPFFRSELIQRVETQLEITLYQKQSDTLKTFANNISQYVSHEEMVQAAFEQITHWSLVDEAGLFQGNQRLLHKKLGNAESEEILKAPTQVLLNKVNFDLQTPQMMVVNSVGHNHPVGEFYHPGHFLFISPQHLPDHLLVFYRNLERKPFDDSKAVSYVQSMISQIQITQNNLESLFEDDKLVSVIGQIQPRLSEITHVKSTSPTLELHFDSDKRPEYIDGCSLEKLSLYFKETLLIRNHKSYLVNPAKVVSLQKASKSRLLKMELSSGEIIPVGRTYMEKIRQGFAEFLQ